MKKLHNLKDIKSKEIDCVLKYIKEHPEKSNFVFMNPEYYEVLPNYKRTFSVISEEYYQHALDNYSMDIIRNEERINKLLEIWSFLACDFDNGIVFGIIEDNNKHYIIGKTQQNNILYIDKPQNIPYEMLVRYAYPYLKNKELLSDNEKEQLKKYSQVLRHYENDMMEKGINLDENNIYKDKTGHLRLLPDMQENKNTFIKSKFSSNNEAEFVLKNMYYLIDN